MKEYVLVYVDVAGKCSYRGTSRYHFVGTTTATPPRVMSQTEAEDLLRHDRRTWNHVDPRRFQIHTLTEWEALCTLNNL